MNDHDDTQIDAALEALARPEPAADHVGRVLARTGGRDASPRRPTRTPDTGADSLRPSPLVWSLATGAALLVVLGATLQMARVPMALPEVVTAGWDSRPYPGNGTPIDLPVLPPESYWGMDPFEEFARLRPTRPDAALVPRVARTRAAAADDEWAGVTETARSASGPSQSMLLPIEMAAIVPPPLVVPPLAPLEDIVLAEIQLSPIVIAPLIEEEKP